MSSKGSSARGELTVDVAIIGAGPAGLTAGLLLSKAGKRVAIIEKDATCVGGLCRTVEQRGYRFDIGGHRLISKNQAVVDLWDEILPEGFIQRPRTSRIYCEGKFYSHPLRVFEALRTFGLWRSGLCVASYLRSLVSPIREVRTFEDWTTNRFGKRLHSIFFKAYAEKLWGIPCEELSADCAALHMQGLSLWRAAIGGLKLSLGLTKRSNTGQAHKTLLENSRYSRLGAGEMWEAARDRIEATGSRIIMNHALKQLATDGQAGWRMTATGPEGELVVNAAHAISSAPMRELAARLYPLPLSTIKVSQLKYRDLLIVALMVRSDDVFPDDSIHIFDGQVQVGRVRKNRSPAMVQDEGAASISLEYFCSEGDGMWSMEDAELVELAGRELASLGLVPSDKVIGGAVVRQEKAYPVYDESYAAKVAAMRAEIEAKHPTLHLVGRNGMHRDCDLDHAMMTAMLTVKNILAGERIHDIWCIEEVADYKAGEGRGPEPLADQTVGPGLARNESQPAAASKRKAA
jgi:protoporphyrinogen oxidase